MFKEYCDKTGMEAVSLTSKNGVPIAFYLENEEENESFSTLSATILGASEVIFSSFEKENPELIVCNSDDSVLLIREVGTNAVLSVLGDAEVKEKMIEDLDKMVSDIEELEKDSEMSEVLKK
ncbi:MAG: roadblock/LC7 domain-containing protein [Candidatus Natronoplasma sp.]